MERQVRHRQPKGTETDWPPCTPPRQSSTLPGEGPGASKRPGLLDKCVGRRRAAEAGAETYRILGASVVTERRTDLKRASLSQKPICAMGFLTGQEVDWLTRASSILRGELPSIEVRAVSASSPTLNIGPWQRNDWW